MKYFVDVMCTSIKHIVSCMYCSCIGQFSYEFRALQDLCSFLCNGKLLSSGILNKIYQSVSCLFCDVEYIQYNTVSKLTFSEEQLSRVRRISAPRSRRVLYEAQKLAGGHSSQQK